MNVSVSSISKLPGGVQKFSLSEDWVNMPDRDETLVFSAPVSFDGEAVNRGEGKWAVRGTISTELDAECNCCLKPVRLKLSFNVDESFERNAQGDDDRDDELYGFSGDTIPLDQMVQDNVLLNIPMRIVCSEGCLGLCPVCGADRNITHCSCQDEDAAHPMHALKTLLNDDEEV